METAFLACKTSDELRTYSGQGYSGEPGNCGSYNKYLKHIVVKRVKIPISGQNNHYPKEQINVTEEFGRFLESQFTQEEDDGDTLPMIQLE